MCIHVRGIVIVVQGRVKRWVFYNETIMYFVTGKGKNGRYCTFLALWKLTKEKEKTSGLFHCAAAHHELSRGESTRNSQAVRTKRRRFKKVLSETRIFKDEMNGGDAPEGGGWDGTEYTVVVCMSERALVSDVNEIKIAGKFRRSVRYMMLWSATDAPEMNIALGTGVALLRLPFHFTLERRVHPVGRSARTMMKLGDLQLAALVRVLRARKEI